MGIKSIGQGLNRRRQNNAPWWARNIKAVVGFLGLVSAVTLAFFSYAVDCKSYNMILNTRQILRILVPNFSIGTNCQ
ncbi:hypothetical protein C7M34_03187 (plasmid) [Lactiplantibacillus plantarum]|nr:hypothetical protein C7M34_03187 [Lactiplantibacillus plantarum]